MYIYLYSHTKRRNSTGIPTGEGTEVSVALKAPTSDHRPTFVLRHDGELAYNYLRWGPRWYWITDKVHRTADVIEISAELDELATLRNDIFATSAYVLYDTAPNTEISDSRLSVRTTATETRASGAFSLLGSGLTDPAVVVTVTGEDAVGSYYMAESTARGLLADVRNWSDNAIIDRQPSTLDDAVAYVGDSLVQFGRNMISAGNAADNIRGAVMLPLPASAFTGTSGRVMLGLYQTGVSALRISNVTVTDWAEVSIPWQASDWRRNSPYTSIRLFIPWVGMMTYPPSALIGASTLRVQAAIDVRTGDALFVVLAQRGDDLNVIGRYNTNVGAAYPIGSNNLAPTSALTAIGSAAGAAATLAAAANPAIALAAGAAGIVGVVNNVTPVETTAGGMGSAAGFAVSPAIVCYVLYHDTVVAPASVSATIGTPAMQVKRLGTLSGYVQTRAASVSSNALQQDIDAVNAALDGGVYIE